MTGKVRKMNWVHVNLLVLRCCRLGQLGRQASCHRSFPTQRGNGTKGSLRSRTRCWLELCTCSLRFFLRLGPRHIMGTCIKVRGGHPSPLLCPCPQYLRRIFFFIPPCPHPQGLFVPPCPIPFLFLLPASFYLRGFLYLLQYPEVAQLGQSFISLGRFGAVDSLSSTRASDKTCSWVASAACHFWCPW